MAKFVVSTAEDVANGDTGANDLSLREAIALANAEPGADVITFADGIGRITLSQALPTVVESLAIRGGGSVTIDADAAAGDERRAFDFAGADRVIIDGLTITGGFTGQEDPNGGAIQLNHVRSVRIINSAIEENHSSRSGGGISAHNVENLIISDSSISRNSTGSYGYGGGIMVRNTSTFSIQGSEVDENSSDYGGGGVQLKRCQLAAIINSEVRGNSTTYGHGGGVKGRDVFISESEVEQNSAGASSGGGIWATGDVTILGSLIRNNGTTGGYHLQGSGGGVAAHGDVQVWDSIVEGNSCNYRGGGISSDGTVRVERSVIRNNEASTYRYATQGGGINADTVYLASCEVSGNTASSGGYGSAGGGVSARKIAAVNSTIAANRVDGVEGDRGGGLYARSIALTSTTISGNILEHDPYGSSRGGGVAAHSIRLENSILVGNVARGGIGDDVSGHVRSDSFSLTGGDGRSVFHETARIAPGIFAGVLRENGGPTRTIALAPDRDNSAIGGADATTAPPTDQRGVARDDDPDLGAFEARGRDGAALIGTAGADRLHGTGRPDEIRGLGGGDVLTGFEGWDSLSGGADDDVLRGNQGSDTIEGGGGSDLIVGGRNDDRLYGGAGSDVFAFRGRFGDDVIADFDARPMYGQDQIDLRPLGVSADSFGDRVTISVSDDSTRIVIEDAGTILCLGVDGENANAITIEDFILI